MLLHVYLLLVPQHTTTHSDTQKKKTMNIIYIHLVPENLTGTINTKLITIVLLINGQPF